MTELARPKRQHRRALTVTLQSSGHVMLEGRRGEENISEPCQRVGIAASMYYGRSKELLEAGKRRLAGAQREAQCLAR